MQEKTGAKLLIFIVAYNAADHIKGVISRIPSVMFEQSAYQTDILLIDDASHDKTAKIAAELLKEYPLKILRNIDNQGYGGNQKLGYAYAIKHEYDAVALLHGDGQYAPECLPELVAPILNGKADAVFGSRMIYKKNALKGGMPFYKFAGNIILTKLQNKMLGLQLSEFHSGYRIYSVKTLAALPLEYNSNDFDFDTDIIIQLANTHSRIEELPIPTYYGNEICYVNGLQYSFKILRTTFRSCLQQKGLYYHPKFDYTHGAVHYTAKTDFNSSHTFALAHVNSGEQVADFGGGNMHIAKLLADKNCTVTCYDTHTPNIVPESIAFIQADLEHPETIALPSEAPTAILLLDVIEHLSRPQEFLQWLRKEYSEAQPKLIVTIPNAAFISVRTMFLFGRFDYTPKGIMDRTHLRFFTRRSLRKLFKQEGFDIVEVTGLPAPFPLVVKNKRIATMCLRLNTLLIRLMPGLFSYQIGLVAKMKPLAEVILAKAEQVQGSGEYCQTPV